MIARHEGSRLVLAAALLGVPLTPALAQSESSSDGTEIIVTAQRREQALQDVPISITVFNQQQISNRNITTTTDLAAYTPSLSVNQRYGADKASFAIRGFNQDQYTSPTVGIYFADVVGVRSQGGTTSGNTVGPGAFMDLQNVQVLKGPQGTLFGRNTTGGAILLVPNRPSDRFEGSLEGTVGNYDARRLQGVLNTPLSDTFKVRFSFDRNKRDGYMKNQSGIGPKDYNDTDYFAARMSVLAELTPDLENLTIAQYSRSTPNGSGSRIVACDPNTQGFALLTASSACEQIARQEARGDSLLDVDINNPEAFLKQVQWQVINTTTWRASDNLTVKNIVSYGEFRERSSFSLYGDNFVFTPVAQAFSAANIPGTPYQYINLNSQKGFYSASESTVTEELQVQGTSGDGKLDYVVGGYLEFSRPLGWQQAQIPVFLNCRGVDAALDCVNPTFVDVPGFGAFPIGSVLVSRSKLSFDNHGIFAQATYKLTDQFSLTGGARYTFDKISAVNVGRELNPYFPGVNNPTCADTLHFAPGTVAVDPAVCIYPIRNKSNKPTWLANIEYKPNSNLMLYAKYARGYRQGGVSPIAIGAETWGPEKVDAYELGAKASFRGSVSGYLNVAAFYNDFSDQQLTAGLLPRPGGSGSATVLNVGKSRIQGFEADAAVTFFDSLKFELGYTYLDTKIVDISVPTLPSGGPYVGISVSVEEGDPLPYSPKNRVSLTGTYTVPLPESAGKLSFGATFVHTDQQGYGNTVANAPRILRLQPATDLLNLNLNWNSVLGSPIDLAAFATNITDERYGVATGGGYAAAGLGELVIGQPRMYGLRVRYSFGS